MAVNRTWRHYKTRANSNGVVTASSDGATGDVHVSGGGYAEIVKDDDSNGASTETTGASATMLCPLVKLVSYYDSPSNKTFLEVTYAAFPEAWVRIHLFTTWES